MQINTIMKDYYVLLAKRKKERSKKGKEREKERKAE